MASKDLGKFTSYWYGYCKDTIKQLWGGEQCTHFSEGLLYAMYYETDVGCIPRGIKLDTKTPSKYSSSKNWNKQISSCYWCRGHSTTHNGICCSKECFFYLHDWCIERVVYFTGRRFCRLPGCGNNTHNDKLYCNDTDRAKFDSLFPKGYDHEYVLKTVIREGPSWYNPNENVLIHSQNKNTVSTCPFQSDFPPELQDLISVHTDIGNIPRGAFSSFHLQTKFSHYPNWSTTIKGCYSCGRADIIDSTNKYFCRIRCYLIFYEWCRSKIESVTEIRFCQYAGCPKRASQGYPCCNSEHSIGIEELYKVNSIKDIGRTSKITPPWYRKSFSPNEHFPNFSSCPTNSQATPAFNQPSQQPHNQPPQQPYNQPPQQPYNQPPQQPYNQSPQQPSQQPYCGPNFIFSLELTQYLYFYTDVGPIPREIRSHRPPPDSVSLQNWNINITMCYWCCQGPHDVKSIACSHKCLFLFNEWLHNIYEKSSNKQLCKNIGCNSLRYPGFQCCNRDHSSYYDSCFKQFNQYLKSTEFALGPLWYTNTQITRIEFYNREDPFYEFTNFYPCDNLYIDGLRWGTSEHYFQAMKFYGTPYFKYVSTMTSPRDAFQFSRTPEATKWLHPQWPTVKLQVMLNVLRVKFSSDNFRTILLRTGNAILVEHTRNDKFWGDGGDGFGENKLGILLMEIRRELQATSNNPLYQQNPMFQINTNNQAFPTFGVNNQNTNIVQNVGTNSNQQNLLTSLPTHPLQTNIPSFLPQTNTASIPPQNNKSSIPPQNNKSSIPPQNNKSSIPPQNNKSSIPSQTNKSSIPPQNNKSSIPSQTNKSSIPPQTNTSSSSLQPSALPFEYSNANSERISDSNKPPCYPSTNPFANLIHEGSGKTTDIVSEPLSTKTEEISGMAPGQKFEYSAKHDLPKDYHSPFGPINLDSVEMGTGQNENPPQVVSLKDSKEKSIENSSTNVVTTLSDKPLIKMCNETGYGSFADISSSTAGQKLEYSAKHDLPEDYHSPFGPNNLDSVEMGTGESENPPQVVSSSDRQHNTDSDPIQSEHTSIVGEDDSSMETSQMEDSRDKDNPEPSNTRLITENKSDSNGLPHTDPHQQYDESNRFAKSLDDKSHVSASDTESS